MLDNRIPPPVLLVFVAAAMWLIARWSGFTVEAVLWRWPIGLGIGSLGLLVLLLGVGAFARAKTTIDPVHIELASTVVTSGIFKVTRNPMYVGFTLILLAWAIVLAAPAAFLGPIFFVGFINQFQIMPEERAMLAKFGDAYRIYQLAVRRWL